MNNLTPYTDAADAVASTSSQGAAPRTKRPWIADKSLPFTRRELKARVVQIFGASLAATYLSIIGSNEMLRQEILRVVLRHAAL